MIYLYVKEHAVTKMKYFGKCTSRHPSKYLGSGKYWRRHINKHGKEHVLTTQVWSFDSQEDASEFALGFSREHSIVESEEWANLIPENGLDGTPIGIIFSDQHKANITKALLNRSDEVKERIRLSNIGKKHTDETKEALCLASTGKKLTDAAKEKISNALKEAHRKNPKITSDETKKRISAAGRGKKRSEETKRKMREAWLKRSSQHAT
jgi:hypothetical protein